MSPTELEMLRDACRCLQDYRKHSECLRKLDLGKGWGFHPTGIHGHPIDVVIDNLVHVIVKYEVQALAAELPHDNEIPALAPINRLVTQLDSKMWEDK